MSSSRNLFSTSFWFTYLPRYLEGNTGHSNTRLFNNEQQASIRDISTQVAQKFGVEKSGVEKSGVRMSSSLAFPTFHIPDIFLTHHPIEFRCQTGKSAYSDTLSFRIIPILCIMSACFWTFSDPPTHPLKLNFRKKVFFPHLYICQRLFITKKVRNRRKTTQYSTFKTDIIRVGLVFSISNFFINKISHTVTKIIPTILMFGQKP